MGATTPALAAGRKRMAVLVLLLALSGGACLREARFRCTEDLHCGAGGTCEPTGACSFDDRSCQSGRRYGRYAGATLANQCVETACPQNPVITVRAGSSHACLVRESGAVECWGANDAGQIGDGGTRAQSSLVSVARLAGSRIVDVALGDRHTCALSEAGDVVCWGASDLGQLGPDGAFVAIAGLRGVSSLAAGAAFTCALLGHASGDDSADDAGAVFCWGRNLDWELGGAAGAADLASSATPVRVDLPGPATAIVARDRHACALVAGRAICWGSNTQYETGSGLSDPRVAPSPVVGLPDLPVTSVAAGATHTCAVTDGRVYCWGGNQVGQLGLGNNQARATPAEVPFLTDVTAITAADQHTCAIRQDGTAWCWGGNPQGQLGEGTTSNANVPVPVVGVGDARLLAAGGSFTCALRQQGGLLCWGDNRVGQLGTGRAIDRLVPTAVAELANVSNVPANAADNVHAIAAGDGFTCARRRAAAGADSTLCWGANQAGQLGDGTRVDRGRAAPLAIQLSAADVAAGLLHACLLGGDGSVWCWGRGEDGRLGGTAAIDSLVPTRVDGLLQMAAVAAGAAHTCARAVDGRAFCWGRNDEGQLGDGRALSPATPDVVQGVGTVVQIALGAAHTCARRTDGRVACWGRGAEGQLGVTNVTSSAIAVVVDLAQAFPAGSARSESAGGIAHPAPPRAVDLACGARHTCAVLDDGRVACWGDGARGQLGYGSTAARPIPTAVMNVGDIADVTAGEAHTCARTRTDGRVFCWGANDAGQLGDGTRASRLTPAPTAELSQALQIAAGGRHSCALRADRRVVCWGANTAGQLGDGGALFFPTAQPVDVACD